MSRISLIDFFNKLCIICNSDMDKFKRNSSTSLYDVNQEISSYDDCINYISFFIHKRCKSNLHDKLYYSENSQSFRVLPHKNDIIYFSETIQINNSSNYLSLDEGYHSLFFNGIIYGFPVINFEDFFIKNNQDQFLEYMKNISFLS